MSLQNGIVEIKCGSCGTTNTIEAECKKEARLSNLLDEKTSLNELPPYRGFRMMKRPTGS